MRQKISQIKALEVVRRLCGRGSRLLYSPPQLEPIVPNSGNRLKTISLHSYTVFIKTIDGLLLQSVVGVPPHIARIYPS